MKFEEIDKQIEEREEGRQKNWLNLKEGENRLRIASEPEPVGKHWTGSKSVICVGKDKGCEWCLRKNVPNVKYITIVIDRADKQAKYCNLPYTVIKTIAAFRTSEDYGFEEIPDFDMVITRKKTGAKPTDVEYYVLPSPKRSKLTEKEAKLVEELIPVKEVVKRMKEKVKGTSEEPPIEAYGEK